MKVEQQTSELYSPGLIEFATIGVEFAALVENTLPLPSFLQQILRILPRLYALTYALPQESWDEETYIEEYITEQAYEQVRQRLSNTLGFYDSFLKVDQQALQYSDTPIAATISEQLADVYQQVGNLLGVLRVQNTEALPQAIARCLFYFREYWGEHLLEALVALHQLYKLNALEDETLDNTENEFPDEF